MQIKDTARRDQALDKLARTLRSVISDYNTQRQQSLAAMLVTEAQSARTIEAHERLDVALLEEAIFQLDEGLCVREIAENLRIEHGILERYFVLYDGLVSQPIRYT